jgi:hypothetical protein
MLTTNTHLIPAFDTGSVPVLTGLRCCDRDIWHDAVDVRMQTVAEGDPDRLRALIEWLEGPTIYDTLVEERGGVR